MRTGPEIDIALPDQLNLTSYYLESNVVAGRGDRVAVYYQDERYSFNDLCALTNRVGNVLRELGVGFEDRVLLVLQDSPEWLAAWYGTMKIGGVATHAYTYLLPDDYAYFLGYVRPKVVVVDATTLGPVREAAASLEGTVLLVAGGDLPPLRDGEYPLAELMASASPLLETAPTSKNDLAFWNFSGGTTGRSKGVPHMHHDGVVAFESFQYTARYTPDDMVFRAPKLFFHYARDLGMNFAFRAGAAVALLPERSSAENMFETLLRYRPTVLLTVPTMMRAMLQSPLAKDADLTFLRFCISSGEPLSAQLYTEFTDRFGVEVLNSVGSAESCLGFFLDSPGTVVPGSSGRVQALVQVRLVDGEGREVPQGETGILHVRSDAVGTYYHLEHEKSKRTFIGDDWLNTNDLFREDEKGYFWYEGRADDLIKVSGVYVAPLEIQKCLEEHAKVRECVVLGVKDTDGLVKTKAFVVLQEGLQGSESVVGELREHCRRRMAPFKTPKFFEFLPELPKTGQGKIDKRQLLERAG
ncbi:MAG: benzoate-CoA ligase family protein [Deltaproteobacteria bacterium]|nr:benzoate-CoA ligase family protein [Deltaproteobacteria bacterium]